MPIPNYNRVLLDLLEEQEETIAKIYDFYAQRFPDHEPFWSKLAKDERNHAKWVRALRGEVEQGSVRVDPRHLKIEEISRFAKWLKQILTDAEAAPMKVAQAFHTAAKIESGLLEEPFQKVFLPSDRKAQKILENLVTQTQGHADAVAKMLEQVGPEDLWLIEKTGETKAPRK